MFRRVNSTSIQTLDLYAAQAFSNMIQLNSTQNQKRTTKGNQKPLKASNTKISKSLPIDSAFIWRYIEIRRVETASLASSTFKVDQLRH